MNIPDYTVNKFGGLNTFIKDRKTLKPGVASDALNWLTAKFGDHIELRRGQALLGNTRVAGPGKITGLGVGIRYDGTQIPFFTHGKKAKYYDATLETPDTVEIGSDILGAIQDGVDTWVAPYQNLGGAHIYIGGPRMSTLKIPVANPGSAVDQDVTDFRFAVFKFGQGRAFGGQRQGTTANSFDKTGVYLSKIDRAQLSDYTGSDTNLINNPSLGNTTGSTATYTATLTPTVGHAIQPGSLTVTADTLEVLTDQGNGTITGPLGGTGTINYVTGAISITYGSIPASGKAMTAHYHESVYAGAAGSTTYSGTIPLSGPQTAMYVSVHELGGELVTDDRNGNLVGSQGATGTINYATGAYTVTFGHATTGIVTLEYYLEDATDGGVLDFDTSESGAGKAKTYRQDDGGGNIMAIWPFETIEYCFHLMKTWQLTIEQDDTTTTNTNYRQIGIPYPRAATPEPEGILCVDLSNPSDPKVRRIQLGQSNSLLSSVVVPTSISDALDLSGNSFDYAVAGRWGDYEIICCQELLNGIPNTYNSTMYIRNVYSGAWDKLDYRASCLAVQNGALLAGDSFSNNVFTLFSGFDDDGGPVNNHWQDGQANLGTDNLKRTHFMRVTGLIQKEQIIQVALVLDDGEPVAVFEIEGDGSYVDQGINTVIGSDTIGHIIGGGTATAHPFDVTFPVHTDIYQYISARFEALNIGHAAINSYTFRDNRDKGRRSLSIKTV